MAGDLTQLTITQAGAALAAGDFSARELAQAHLDLKQPEAVEIVQKLVAGAVD